MQGQYNLRSPAVKRLMREAQELREPTAQFHAQPLEDNLFEWHFTIRGPDETEFEGGFYHGRIILPPDYPMKPPSIIILTSNGRFEVNTKICLSISGHHPESWQPSWSIRTALLAIIGFMPTHGGGAIGSLDYTADERKRLAKRSQEFKCPSCGAINNLLRPVSEVSVADKEEAKELASQINFQAENANKKGTSEKKESEKSQSQSPNTSSATTPSASTSASPSTSPNTSPGFPTLPPTNPWASMPRFPFMPFMRPPGTSTTSAMSQHSGVPILPMSAIQAAMQERMRNHYLSRFPQAVPSTTKSTTSSPESSSSKTNVTSPPLTSGGPAESVKNKTTVSSSSSSNSSLSSVTSSSASPSASSSTAVTSPTSTASTSQTPTSTTEGLRQRTTGVAGSSSTNRTTRTEQPADLRPQRASLSRSGNAMITTLIVLLAIAFVALLVRRLLMMGFIRYEYDQDADF